MTREERLLFCEPEFDYKAEAWNAEEEHPGLGVLQMAAYYAVKYPITGKLLDAIAMSKNAQEAAKWVWECEKSHWPGQCPLCGAE